MTECVCSVGIQLKNEFHCRVKKNGKINHNSY